MADDNKRQPVPAGGAPIPAAIDNADQTPPAGSGDADVETAAAGELVEARVLLAFGEYDVNDIIADTPDAIETMRLSGSVDPHLDAVAHAKSL